MGTSLGDCASSADSWLERRISAFEDAWQAGSRPSIDKHLLDAGRNSLALLVELVHLDLEYRLRACDAARVEEYFRQYPELALDDELATDLIASEFRWRQEIECGLSAEDYAMRFPEWQEAVRCKLRAGVEDDATFRVRITCPKCHGTIELADWCAEHEVKCCDCGYAMRIGADQMVSGLASGARFARFQLEELLGSGTFGIVWKAHDTVLDRTVALKFLHVGCMRHAEVLERFLREGRAASQLRHPGIAAAYEAGIHQGVPYLVSDYIAGTSLDLYRREKQLTFRAAARLVARLAEAVDYAHRQGVVHRDLKPSNVMVKVDGEAGAISHASDGIQPVVTDFGLALREDDGSTMTVAGQILCTPAYMSPEQAAGSAHVVDARTDIYSLGVILYELITGRVPFQGGRHVVVQRLLSQDPKPPSDRRTNVPRDLEAICLKCLEKSREHRYTTADELAADLQRYLENRATVARPLGPVPRAWRWSRRKPIAATLLATTLLFATLIATISWWHSRASQRMLAREELLRVQAEASERRAKQNEQLAIAREELSNEQAYSAQMQIAQRAWDMHRVTVFEDLLSRYRETKLAGFEWRYLNRLSQHGRIVLRPMPSVEVDGVAFSPDEVEVATANRDGTVDIWKARDGAHIDHFRAHEVCANLVRYSPDGRLLATASCDGTIRLWDAESHRRVAQLTDSSGPINNFAFDPAGRLIYSTSLEQLVVKIWSISSSQPIGVLESTSHELNQGGIPHALQVVDVSPDGTMVAAGGNGSYVYVFDTTTREEICAMFDGTNRATTALCFLPGQPRVAYGTRDGRIVVAEVPSGDEVQSFSIVGIPRCMTATQDGSCLLVGTSDSTIDVCDLEYGTVAAHNVHRAEIRDVAVVEDGNRVGTASVDGTSSLVQLAKRGTFEHVPLPFGSETLGIVNPHAGWLCFAQSGGKGEVQIIDVGRELHTRALPRTANSPCKRLRCSFDGEYVVLFAEVSREVWRLTEQPYLVRPNPASAGSDNSVDRDFLYVTVEPDTATVRDSRDDRVIADLQIRDPDPHQWDEIPQLHRFVAQAGNDAVIFNLLPPRRLGSYTALGRAKDVAISPNNRLIAVSAGPGVRLYEIATGRRLFEMLGDGEKCSVLAFSRDGRTLAVGDDTGNIRLWNVTSGIETLLLTGHATPVVGLTFSQDDSALLSIAGDEGRYGRITEAYMWRAGLQE